MELGSLFHRSSIPIFYSSIPVFPFQMSGFSKNEELQMANGEYRMVQHELFQNARSGQQEAFSSGFAGDGNDPIYSESIYACSRSNADALVCRK